jgi:hypothetical protein
VRSFKKQDSRSLGFKGEIIKDRIRVRSKELEVRRFLKSKIQGA